MVKIGPLELTVYTQEDTAYQQKRAKLPTPGRCADRIEDMFFVLRQGWHSSLGDVQTVFATVFECYRSDDGDEPRGPYVRLTQESPLWRDHAARPSKYSALLAAREQAVQLQRQQDAERQQQQASRLGWLWGWWRQQAADAPAAAAVMEPAAAEAKPS